MCFVIVVNRSLDDMVMIVSTDELDIPRLYEWRDVGLKLPKIGRAHV